MANEKRKAKRRPVLESFSFFVVLPKQSPLKHELIDLSDLGIAFELDVEGEDGAFVEIGGNLEIQLYLNQTLYLPLEIKVIRLESHSGGRKLGGEISDRSTKSYRAYQSVVKLLDQLLESAEMKKS